MRQEKNLRLLTQKEIDYEKWDLVIEGAANSRVYALSWYLDRTATVWEALVWDDYKFVMPLPVGRKWGVRYIYQPFFCQQLGIFPPAPPEIQTAFAAELMKKYHFFQFQVNPQFDASAFTGFEVSARDNYILPLLEPYAALVMNYKSNARNHIAKAYKKGVRILNTLDATQYVELKKQHTGVNVDNHSYKILARLISWSLTNGNGQIVAAISPANDICAAAFFLKSGNRIVYLNSFSTPEGRKLRAMYAILNDVIRRYENSGLLFDFEGSSVESIATFFKSFNPSVEQYYYLYRNNLPFPLNYLKRNSA